MPFEEAWSDGTYTFIRRVAATVSADFSLVIERADEITASGRITDQIETAIQRSAVVIADITGVNPGEPARNHPNPNVMWELGYAHALGKEVIILNQDPKQSPFDLSVHRQVAYATIPTSANEQLLERHLRHALGAPP
jgi:nucleoside 2-deoxyribosyltransferase